MPLVFNSYSFSANQGRAELRRKKPDVDPTIFGSFPRSMIDSAAAMAYDTQLIIRDLSVQLFPQTAEGEYLERWGAYEALPRNATTGAFGFISLQGTVGTIIPSGTRFTSQGLQYESQSVSTIQNVNQLIDTLTYSSGTVTATTVVDHSLASGLDVTISGADQPEYNGTFSITVVARNQFTYDILSPPVATPATGIISLTSTYASISVACLTPGQDTNLDGAALLSIVTAIPNAGLVAYAQFDGLSGGTETETDDPYRNRVILSRSIREGVFTADQVELAALSVPGNTRAFVKRPELTVADPNPTPASTPAPGQVFIYILRDNDANILPTQTILNTTKDAIISNGRLPSHTAKVDVLVFAPIPIYVDFIFASLDPDTPTMRNAVFNNLKAFFEDTVDFEKPVLQASYLGTIQNTQDLATGEFINSFSLLAPVGDIIIGAGEIAILGTVTFP